MFGVRNVINPSPRGGKGGRPIQAPMRASRGGRGGRGGRGRGRGARRAELAEIGREVARARREQEALLQGQLSEEPNLESALGGLQSQLRFFTEYLRDPTLPASERNDALARRNVVEQTIQSLEASGVLPQQVPPPTSSEE